MDYTYWAEHLRELKHNEDGREEVILEGEGPYRLSFLIRVMMHEPEAAKEEIAAIFNAYQGRLGVPVRWLFSEKGEVLVSKYRSETTEDQIMLAALSVGAEDVEFGDGDVVRILCSAGKLEQIAELLDFEDVYVYDKRLCYQPQALFDLHTEQEIETVIALMEALAERDDVLDIAADFELDDVICKKMGYDVY